MDSTFEKDWHFATTEDREIGVETAIYKNGKPAKRFKISDGREVIARRLKGKDHIDVEIMTHNKIQLVMASYLHLATKVDGRQLTIEEFEELDGPDYVKIKHQFQSINF